MNQIPSKKIIPLFIPHLGCPNDCVFCNQRKITGRTSVIDFTLLRSDIESALHCIGKDKSVEIAFYGGSFTAIDRKIQEECLKMAVFYKAEDRRITDIRISTRPDCIDEEVLAFLKKYQVSIIELGVQSFDDEVLLQSNRGHDVQSVYRACEQIKKQGFLLGIQLMIGLPKDDENKVLHSCWEVVKINPNFVRIYPVLVIRETALERQMKDGSYLPLTLEETIAIGKKMYLIFISKDIKIIRIGLQSSEQINIGREVLGGPFHPAIGEQIISAVYRDWIEYCMITNGIKGDIEIFCRKNLISKIIGNRKTNVLFFRKKYGIALTVREDAGRSEEEIQINGLVLTFEEMKTALWTLYFGGGKFIAS